MANVLLIDSDRPLVDELMEVLQARGASVHATGDGNEGLNQARDSVPDVIMLCVELDRGSGYSICNKLKKDRELAPIPLILTSAQATVETFEQHKKLRTRAEVYLKKPFQLDEALELIGRYTELTSASDSDARADSSREANDEFEAELADLASELEGDNEMGELNAQDVNLIQGTSKPSESPRHDASGAGPDAVTPGPERRELDALRHEISEYETIATRAQAEAQHHKAQLEQLRGEVHTLQNEKQVLSDKLGELVEKVKSLASERDAAESALRSAEERGSSSVLHEETARKVREKAKRAVDIAMQLINETGLAR